MNAAINERITGDDFGNQVLHAIAIFLDSHHYLIDYDLIVAFELAAQERRQAVSELGSLPARPFARR